MSRAIWEGSINFGLVEIPVALLSAQDSKGELKFSFLDRRDLSPVGNERISKTTGKEVSWDQIVRGYEHEEGEYVVLTEQDFKRANIKAASAVEILSFTDAASIEPIYFEKPYYLEPLKKNSKGYALLRETLRRTGKVGIAKVVIRTRQHLAALLAHGPVLILNLLRFAHEIRDPKEIQVPDDSLKKIGVSGKEIEMAEKIIEGMVEPWNPKSYRDEYRDDLLALIRKRVKSGQTKLIEEPEGEDGGGPRAEVVDLMPLLKQSVKEGRGSKGRAKTGTRAKGSSAKSRSA